MSASERQELDDRGIELATLTGALAHEIRNPLSTLKVNLQLLSEDFRDESIAETDLRRRSLTRLERLRDEIDRLEQTLDDFLNFANPHDVALQPVDLNRLITDLADFFEPQAAASGVRVGVSLADPPPTVPADRRLMSQALLNLMLNAQDAMPEGGELILRTRRPDENHVCIEVIDTGPGIPPEELERVFQAFYSTKAQGTGLGLATARRIVREHGGTLHVQSEPDQGCRFEFTLPLHRGEGTGE